MNNLYKTTDPSSEAGIENAVALAIATHHTRAVKLAHDVDWTPWIPTARVAIAAYRKIAANASTAPLPWDVDDCPEGRA